MIRKLIQNERQYQDEDSHHLASCKPQTTCVEAQYLDGASTETQGTCKVCQEGKYQSSESHQTIKCPDQPKCGKGTFYYLSSGAEASRKVERSCKPCSAGMYV